MRSVLERKRMRMCMPTAHAYEYVHANMRTRYACAAYGACAVCATAYDTRTGYLRTRGRRPAQQRQAPPKIRGALGVRGW